MEPNKYEFEYQGYPCILWRSYEKAKWCGYVGLKPDHPWYGKHYKDIPVPELSYSRECGGPICHKTEEKEHLWWIGMVIGRSR